MTTSPIGLSLVAGINVLVGIVIGWILRSRMDQSGRALNGGQPASAGASSNGTDRATTRLLERIGSGLDGHAEQFSRLREMIHSRVAIPEEDEPSDELQAEMRAVADGNTRFKTQLETQAQQLVDLIDVGDELLSALPQQLTAYQAQAEQLGEMFNGPTRMLDLLQNPDQMLSMVSQLLDTQQGLRSELASAREELNKRDARLQAAEHRARHDVLTKLPNRREFDEQRLKAHQQFEENGQRYSCILFDIDNFKSFNDNHGHAAGDSVLTVFGRILQDSSRASDLVCRFGGEEFAALCPKASGYEAFNLAERVRRRLENTIVRFQDEELRVTVSTGVAEIQVNESSQELLMRTDMALYEAKAKGRNRSTLDEGTAPAAVDPSTKVSPAAEQVMQQIDSSAPVSKPEPVEAR